MDVKTIQIDQQTTSQHSWFRPGNFQDFVGQSETKKIIQAAIKSATTREQALWHLLFSWQSWYGKTTLAQIVASYMTSNIKIITWYAISKPAEMVSLLNSLSPNDILFIDELHRLRASVEEVLYIAMEDYCIDMIMPDGGSVRIPLAPFTLIWATTKLEALSTPLKNRFIYKFHFSEYTEQEKQQIIARYISHHTIQYDAKVIAHISDFLPSVPREIANTCTQLHDYLVAHFGQDDLLLDLPRWKEFLGWRKLTRWWITSLHQSYLDILTWQNWQPVWLKTLAVRLWMSEKAVEEDIEPLLFKMNKITKTSRWRILI